MGCNYLSLPQIPASGNKVLKYNAERSLRWRRDGRDSVSNHQPHHCLLNRLFRCWSKKTSKLHVTGLCVGNSPGTGEFPAQMASNVENVSIWWRHHACTCLCCCLFVVVMPAAPTLEHTEAETKWLPFRRRYFQIHWLEWKCVNFV